MMNSHDIYEVRKLATDVRVLAGAVTRLMQEMKDKSDLLDNILKRADPATEDGNTLAKFCLLVTRALPCAQMTRLASASRDVAMEFGEESIRRETIAKMNFGNHKIKGEPLCQAV